MENIGENIRVRRMKRGWSQQELAVAAGVTVTTICNLEQGLVKKPHPNNLNKIMEVLESEGL